ncbi:MAG: hypothetical protein F9K40_08390 [Kofleriaceae bacterium]|nr:MAG: hypothetical protein F9K40_08390 [Kofleriaceae bacterium]
MRIATVWMAAVVAIGAIAGCGKKKEDAGGTGTGTGTGTGSGTGTGTGSVAAGGACELDGQYRLKFPSNGAKGWFLRFEVKGTEGKLTESQAMLGVDPGPLAAVTLDPAACKLNVRGSGISSGDLGLALEVDATTGAVKGQMTRTKAVKDDDKAVAVEGWRTAGAPAMPDACFVPGVYKIKIDPKATWKNADPDDDRSCADEEALDVLVRVEGWGDGISIDQVDNDPPHAQAWGDETVKRTGCEVELKLVTEAIDLDAYLTFVGDKVTGLVNRAKIQVVQETDESEELWDCVTEKVRVDLVKM